MLRASRSAHSANRFGQKLADFSAPWVVWDQAGTIGDVTLSRGVGGSASATCADAASCSDLSVDRSGDWTEVAGIVGLKYTFGADRGR